jgi:hypothetical protein
MRMKITGKYGIYECMWRQYGYAYAEIVIFKTIYHSWFFNLFNFTTLRKVHSYADNVNTLLTLKFDRMKNANKYTIHDIYSASVREYEKLIEENHKFDVEGVK